MPRAESRYEAFREQTYHHPEQTSLAQTGRSSAVPETPAREATKKEKSSAVKERLDLTPQTRSFLPEDFMEEEKILSERRPSEKTNKAKPAGQASQQQSRNGISSNDFHQIPETNDMLAASTILESSTLEGFS